MAYIGYRNIFNIKMDVSLIDSLTHLDPSTQSNSVEQTSPQGRDPDPFCKKQPVLALRERIQNRQQQRVKSQWSRKMRSKQNEVQQWTKKCMQLERQIKNIACIKEGVDRQKQEIIQKSKAKQVEMQCLQSQLQKQEEQKKRYQIELQKIHKENQCLLKQLNTQKDKYDSLCKQHKIQARRANQQYESSRLELQGKLAVKQKQNEKLQIILSQKNKEHTQTLAIRDEELAYVRQSYKELQVELRELQMELQRVQREKISQYEAFQEQVERITNQMQQSKHSHSSFVEKILQGMRRFKEDLQLKGEDEDILRQFQKWKQQLRSRQECKHFEQKIAQLSQEIMLKVKIQRQLSSKVEILGDELSFLRNQLKNNINFAAIIKSQMSVQPPPTPTKIQQSKAPLKSTLPASDKRDKEQQQGLITKNSTNFRSQQLPHHPLTYLNRYSSQLTEKYSVAIEQPSFQRAKGKSTNDFIKEQLQSKKKSLIYLLYRRQDCQKNDENSANSQSKPRQNLHGAIRKRSSSLSQLVSTRCRQQML